MSSFTQAMRIIDNFIEDYYPESPTGHLITTQTPQGETLSPAEGSRLPSERTRVPLLSSLGQTSCSTVRAQIQMPLFDNSAMDGYALSSAQTTSASPDQPLTLRVLGIIAAGDPPPTVSERQEQSELTCWAIMTGAPFPIIVDAKAEVSKPPSTASLYDACVKLELVTAHYQPSDSNAAISSASVKVPTHITITAPVDSNANRRLAGEDIRIGDALLNAGDTVRKEHVMVLASMGVQDVKVEWDGGMWARQRQMNGKGQRRLRIGIINTGKEVVLNAKPETEAMTPVATPPIADDIAVTNGSSTTKAHPRSTDCATASQDHPRNPVDPLTPPTSCNTSRSTSVADATRQARPYLGASQIWNSNGPYIHAALLTWGFHPSDIEVLSVSIAEGQDGDDPEAFQATVKDALSYKNTSARPFDVLISTGGVSTGVHDYVPSSILALGGEIGFHKLKMRPGGPMMFARLAHDLSQRNAEAEGNETNKKETRAAYFGLPGNPLAAAVCLRFIVAPALQKMRGIVAGPQTQLAEICTSERAGQEDSQRQDRVVIQKKPPHTRMYVPARSHTSSATGIEGETSRVEALARGSNMTRALLSADSWVCFDEGEGRDKIYEGDKVEVYSLDL
ncbi:hypothetical protein QFC21_001775 [Naganishia friedmannii]|uniref:Uncharacterized protein n=1 Tax=Naganishia friedmannii TaxID=89922 RepID=A0ACC2W2R6_9TREE|nr:hypothetical protein QFC21_001775 [Naganishia friedmannii]